MSEPSKEWTAGLIVTMIRRYEREGQATPANIAEAIQHGKQMWNLAEVGNDRPGFDEVVRLAQTKLQAGNGA